MRIIAALLSGLVFGFGLALSGMLNPVRVLGFLDLAGAWDPSLAFVLAGAVVVSAGGYLVSRRLARPALAPTFDIPASRRIDLRLIGGAALFGIGWGMAGFCPGPAIASLSLGYGKSVLFVAAMLVGMAAFRFMPAAPRARHA
ncbi:MAG: YeeE/YedE family protein [Acetobacteraceae bacterium]|nr:YeeE/YedE family protein [Acetobacteraceae bacterium]